MSKATIYNLSGANNTLNEELTPKTRKEFMEELKSGKWSVASPPPRGARRPPKHPGKTKKSVKSRGIAFRGGKKRSVRHRPKK